MSAPFPSWPVHDQNQRDAVERVLRSGCTNQWTGTDVARFESRWSALHDDRPMAAVANGSVAMEAALIAIGIQPGDRVLVPCRTFVASAMSVLRVGALPVFCDVDAVSGLLTVDTLEAQWAPGTFGMFAVHLAGRPLDMEAICDWAAFRGVRVIEDVAQAHGGQWKGRTLGTFGDAAAWSFCQDKIVSTGGEGGMVSANCMDAVHALRDHGRGHVERDSTMEFQYVRLSIGTNLRMTGVQAAIGSAQTARLAKWVDQRAENHAVLRERLHGVGPLTVPMPEPEAKAAWYRCMLHTHADQRSDMLEALQKEQWPVSAGACPDIAREPALQHVSNAQQERPGAALCASTSIALPVHPTADCDDMHRLADAVLKSIGEHVPVKVSSVSPPVGPCVGRRIAITGGAGSIGSSLIGRLLDAGAAHVAVIDRSEAALHKVQERWSGDARVQVALLDVCDEDALETCLRDNEIQDAVHAAAHKHVPLVEASPAEGIRNNVFGTKSALGACALAGVERFVFLSTDKAVEPVGVMGATKRLAEELVRASSMQTAVLRCCNVLDSKGSVTETFRRRLVEGLPLELTHVQASRWFTSMDDIGTWLVHMLALADDGSVFIPQVHEQVRIEDLARSIEQDLGLDPAVLKITGLRAGERIAEHALTTGSTKPTAVDGLLRVQEPQLPDFDMQTLASVCSAAPPQQVREMVLKMARGSIALESQEC